VLGVGSGRLAEEIVRQSRCDVIAIDPDAAKVNKLRAAMCDKGLYGSRIAIHTADPKTFRFPPYLASLIVSEDPSVLGDCDAAFVKRLAQSLRPYGGTLAITTPGKSISQTRPGPLPETADWSHRNANAANTGASQDHFLAAPLTRLWFDGSFRWERKPGHVVVRVAGGRLLMKTHRELRAFDVYTGRCLWTVPASSGEMVAVDDAIHLVNGRSLKVLDVAGGEQTAQIDLPKELTRPLANLRIADDRIVGNSGNTLVAMDRSGKLLWKSDREKPIGSIAMGNGSVFCGDAVQRRRGQPEPTDVATTAHDLRSGKQLWRVDGSEARYSEPLDLLVTSRGAFRAKDGEEVWRGPGFGRITHDRLIRGNADEMFVHDLKTGKQLGGMRHWNRRGCTSLRASANLLTSRFRGNAAYVDLESGEITSIWNVRAACSNNLFPANGVLNVPGMTGGCTCNYIPTSQAFVPSSAFE